MTLLIFFLQNSNYWGTSNFPIVSQNFGKKGAFRFISLKRKLSVGLTYFVASHNSLTLKRHCRLLPLYYEKPNLKLLKPENAVRCVNNIFGIFDFSLYRGWPQKVFKRVPTHWIMTVGPLGVLPHEILNEKQPLISEDSPLCAQSLWLQSFYTFTLVYFFLCCYCTYDPTHLVESRFICYFVRTYFVILMMRCK